MPKSIVFVAGGSLKTVKEREERQRIRSNIIKASWRARKQSRGPRHAANREADRAAEETEDTATAQPASQHVEGGGLLSVSRHVAAGCPSSTASLLSAARSDPFSTTGLSSEDAFGHSILDYCVTGLWPAFRPHQAYAHDFARFWFPRAARSATVMSAILFSGSIHQEMRLYVEQSPANHMRLSRQLRLKGAAIKTLRDSLAGGVAFDQIDETIYAILCLAVNQNASLTDRRTPDGSNFDAPFLGVQWLTLYGTMDFDPTHFAAIRALVQRKGGIANLEAYSLGWLIFFAALMGAASRLSPPEFSPVTVHGEPYQYQNPLRLLRVFEMPYHFRLPRGGFHLFERTSIRPDIIQTFLDISEMSQAIQIYLADNRQSRALTDILDSRNDLMYRLLCLPDTLRGPLSLEENPAFAAQNQGMYHMLYLCARLAAQLYSLHVIFPIPTTASIRQTLIPDLLEKVAWFDNLRTVEGSQQLLLWVCVVTAVAVDDDDLDTRGWFVSRCRQLISGLGITTYDDLKDLLHLFGWIDSACDRGGFNIWNMTNIFTH